MIGKILYATTWLIFTVQVTYSCVTYFIHSIKNKELEIDSFGVIFRIHPDGKQF